MLVECMIEDFSDPEAVSGSSTTVSVFFTTGFSKKKDPIGAFFDCREWAERAAAAVGWRSEKKTKTKSFGNCEENRSS